MTESKFTNQTPKSGNSPGPDNQLHEVRQASRPAADQILCPKCIEIAGSKITAGILL